ncbi:MAG: hypothetical protein RL077_6091 [Verrucomicrobiota bacterium]
MDGSIEGEKVLEDFHTTDGGDGFWVELDAPNGEGFMAETHDLALGGFGGDFEYWREGGAFDEEGMIARGGEALGHVPEKIGIFVLDGGGFPMH